MVSFSKVLVAASATLLALSARVAALSGNGVTTRYWDCCKPSCSWPGKAAVSNPVLACDKNQNPISDSNAVSGCDGGTAYTCANMSPWKVSDNLAYGFAAVSISGGTEGTWCCQCYQLTFTSGPAAGKVMIVQATNTGGDLGSNQFDLLMPGGGVGAFNGCPAQYGSWDGGAQYGGVSSASQCANLPSLVQAGCNWRFDWFMGSDNPSVSWTTVQCPAAITDLSGCVRNDQGGQPPVSVTTAEIPTTTPETAPGTTTPETTTSETTTSETPYASPGSSTSPNGGDSSGDAPLYGQCGGQGWTGPTTCASGTCKVSNAWYSQCLPQQCIPRARRHRRL